MFFQSWLVLLHIYYIGRICMYVWVYISYAYYELLSIERVINSESGGFVVLRLTHLGRKPSLAYGVTQGDT